MQFKSLRTLRRGVALLQGFYRQQPASRLATDLHVDVKVMTRIDQRVRTALYHVTELEGARLSGEIELDESSVGDKRKGPRGRGALGKRIVVGLLEREGRVSTNVIEHVTADTLLAHIRAHTRTGAV